MPMHDGGTIVFSGSCGTIYLCGHSLARSFVGPLVNRLTVCKTPMRGFKSRRRLSVKRETLGTPGVSFCLLGRCGDLMLRAKVQGSPMWIR